MEIEKYESIYLIDMGDQIAWAEDPHPSGNEDDNNYVEYVLRDGKYTRDLWTAAVNSTDDILKETIRKSMADLGKEPFMEWLSGFVGA